MALRTVRLYSAVASRAGRPATLVGGTLGPEASLQSIRFKSQGGKIRSIKYDTPDWLGQKIGLL